MYNSKIKANLFTIINGKCKVNRELEKLNEKTSKETYDFIVLNDGDQKKFSNEDYIKNKNTDVLSMKRKIINRDILIKHKILFTNYKYFNLLYLFQVNENARKIGYIEKLLVNLFIQKK